MGAWDNLSIREKADMMRAAIRNGITTLPEIKQAYNEFAEGGNIYGNGGSKKSGGSFYQTHKARWNNYLLRHGVPAEQAARLSGFFSAQDALESGHGTSSAARQKNNFGGMQRLDKKTNKMVNISYPSVDAYMDAKWKMMRSRFGRALNAKTAQEYSDSLNNPKYHGKGYMYALYEGYRDGQPLDVARQTKHMNNYTKALMSIAGEKGFKASPVPTGSQSREVEAPASIARPENPYTQFIPFEPFNPQAFGAPQAFVAPTREEFEIEQPLVEAANDYAYSPEQLEKEERRQGLNNLSFILGMMNGGNGSSFADTIGMLTGNIVAEGGKIHIKPENRGKFTALKERTGHSATWFKEHGTPAQKKMATFALNAAKWKHGLGGNLYEEGGPEKKWKALDNIDFVAIPDTSFTRDKTGLGSIEYFDSRYPEGIIYPNGYHREHPLPGKDVILYNPNDNDEQDIRLDALHIMPKDATYDTLYSQYLDEIYTGQAGDLAWKGVKKWEDDAKKYGKNNIDTKNQYIRNEADGLLRNYFIEGDSDYRKQKGYSASKSDAVKEFPTLVPYIDAIQNYLVTGERPANILPEVTITGKKRRKGRKHGYGGHIYDGLTEDDQQMNIPYAGELPDVTVMPRRIANKAWDKVQERWVGDMPTYYAVNPETGKEEMLREIGNGKYSTYDDKHVFDVLGAEAAKKQKEQWIKNGGNAGDFDKVMLSTLGLGLAPIALPEIAAGVGTALTNPYVDAGLTSYFGAHGLNHAINEGIDGWGDAAMTALEVAPLGRLAKPLYEGVVQPGMRLFNSPLTGKWTAIGNKQYRLSPNSLGANGSPIESRKLGEYSTGIDLNKMRSIFEDYEKGLTQYKGSKSPSSLEYNYEMPKIDFDDLVKDDFTEYLSQQTGRKIKRVPIKDTKHGDIYNEGFAFVDDEGKELAYIAGRKKGGKNVWVESSYVDPEFRYKGLGKQMYFDLNDHIFSTYGTTLHSDPMQRVGSTGAGMSPSNRLWKSLRDKGISTVEGEGFNRYDIMAEPSKIATAYRTPSAPQITAENESVQNESIKDMFRRILSGNSDGIKTTEEMAEMGRKDLLDEISSPWYKERWKKATNGNDEQIDDLLSRMRVRITDVPMDYSKTTEQLSGKPGFVTYGATVPREPHKFNLSDGTPVTDYNTGLDVQIASDRGVKARNTAYHELQHYLTNKATGTASYPSLKFIANGPYKPLITPTSDGELLIGRGDAWQHFIMDQNEALLPERAFVYEEAIHSPQKLKKRLVEIGRTPEEADDLILKLKDEAQDMMDIQEQRAHLKTWFTKDILPLLKNPNDASEIERVLAEHPDIMESRPEKIKTLMEELRPGSIKDYAKYLAESLGIIPFIVNTNSKEK